MASARCCICLPGRCNDVQHVTPPPGAGGRTRMEKRRYKVGSRLLVEGTLEIEATSRRRAREIALTKLSDGLVVLKDMPDARCIGHDAQDRRSIIECDTAEKIAVLKEEE